MGSNFTIFESAVSALSVNSQALSVAAQNIANVNTPGYSRQYAVLQSRTPQSTGGFELGRGVEVADIRQVYDSFAELRLRSSQDAKSRYDSTAQSLQQVETLFNEIGKNGLAQYASDFFNAFHDVGTDPTSASARLNLMNKATVMIDRFHNLSTKLEDAKNFIDGDIRNNVTNINNLAAEISNLNLKIQAAGSGSDLTFKDQRNSKIQELAKYIDLSTVETSEGQLQIYVAQGVQLVNGVYHGSLSTRPNVDNNNHLDVLFNFNNSQSNITSRINGGSLKGLLDARDNYISGYQDQMDEMAYQVSKQVNDIHTTGYDLNANTLREFFDEDVFATDIAAGATLATNLKDSSGAHLRIKSGDVVTISGSIGGAFSSTFTIGSSTTLTDMAASLQASIRASGVGTETVTVQNDGSLRVTAAGTDINNLQMSITGKSAFNTAFDFAANIAATTSGDSDTLNEGTSTGAAGLISLDSLISASTNAIAASGSSADLPGGNSIAVALANLQNSQISFSSGSTTFAGFYGNVLATIGSDSKSFRDRAQFAADVTKQAEIQREQISGVSLDEEQLNLIKYQTAFQAASRLVSIASEILQSLVQLGT